MYGVLLSLVTTLKECPTEIPWRSKLNIIIFSYLRDTKPWFLTGQTQYKIQIHFCKVLLLQLLFNSTDHNLQLPFSFLMTCPKVRNDFFFFVIKDGSQLLLDFQKQKGWLGEMYQQANSQQASMHFSFRTTLLVSTRILNTLMSIRLLNPFWKQLQ